MLSVSVFCVLLLLLTTLIHYEALRLLTAGLPKIVSMERSWVDVRNAGVEQ